MGYAKISRPRVQFSFPIVGFPSLASRRIEPQSTTQGCIARRALLRPQRPWTLASNPHARAVCQPRPELTSMPSRLPTPPLPAYRPRLPSGLIRFRLIALPLPGRPHPRPHHSHSRSRSHVRTILHSFSQCHAPPPLICPRPSLALGRPISRASYGAEAALYHVQQLPRTRRQVSDRDSTSPAAASPHRAHINIIMTVAMATMFFSNLTPPPPPPPPNSLLALHCSPGPRGTLTLETPAPGQDQAISRPPLHQDHLFSSYPDTENRL